MFIGPAISLAHSVRTTVRGPSTLPEDDTPPVEPGTPPVLARPPVDLDLRPGAVATEDLAAAFDGTNLVLVLAPGSDPLPGGLVLSSAGRLEGVVPAGPVGPLSIVVRASNSSGHADADFSLMVRPATFTTRMDGLTDTAEHGPAAVDGTTLRVIAEGFSHETPSGVTYLWQTGSGTIPGATAATFVPDAAAQDGQTLCCTISAPGYPDQTSAMAVVRHVPPLAAGDLHDEIFDLDSGVQTVDASTGFTGAALTFAVDGPGVQVDPATGVLTISTDSPVAGATVTVTATNSGGSARASFLLAIEDEVTPGDLSPVLFDAAKKEFVLSVDMPGTVHWRRQEVGQNPDAVTVLAGGGHDSGSFPVTEGANTVDIDFAEGNDGPQQISFVAVFEGVPSTVRHLAITVDTVAPVLSAAAAAIVTGTSVTARVTSDEGNGQLHAGLWQGQTPDAAMVQTGAGALWHATATAIAGVNTFDATGLADASVGVWSFLQVDAAGNASARVTAMPVAPEGPAGPAPEYAADFTTAPATTLNGLAIPQLTGTGYTTLVPGRTAGALSGGDTGAWRLGNTAAAQAQREHLRFKLADPTKAYTIAIRSEAEGLSKTSIAHTFKLRWTDDSGNQIGSDIHSISIQNTAIGYTQVVTDTANNAALAGILTDVIPPAGATCFEIRGDWVRFDRIAFYLHHISITRSA